MFSEDDLDSMLDELGADASYGEDTLRGVYRAPNQNLTVFTTDLNSDTPTFLVKQSAVAALGVDIGSMLVLNGIDFTVSDTKAENSGFCRLALTRG